MRQWELFSCSSSISCEVIIAFFRCPRFRPNIAVFLTCKMKGNRGQYGQENESFLIPLVLSHSTGILVYHSYAQGRQESALFMAFSQALRTYFMAAWKPKGSLSPSLVKQAMVTSWGAISLHTLHEWCSRDTRSTSSPFPHYMLHKVACRQHHGVHGHLHCAAPKSAGIFLYPLLERTLVIW